MEDGAFVEIGNDFKNFSKNFRLDIWLGSKYASALSTKVCEKATIKHSPEILHKFVSLLFFKIVVLKACSYSKPISNFKHLQQSSFLGDLQLLEELFLSLCFWNWP